MACPPRADVVAFSQGTLRGPQWDDVSTHLQVCAECQAIFAALGQGDPTSHLGGPPPPGNEPIPSRIGRYVVLDQLGQGGMGRVYSAYHPELDRRVALKVLHGKAGDEVASTRLRREAQAMARLDHPNVVAVHDVGEDAGRLFVVMERVEGETLEQRLVRGPLPVDEALSIIRQAGHGLVAAHQAGLVHRDLKPANILVSGDGRVRVADFGIARFAAQGEEGAVVAIVPDQDTSRDLTKPGLVAGTPSYMAPEQLRGGLADERSDQFSFCITAYKALYGDHPFDLTAPIDRRYQAPRSPAPRGEPRTVRAAILKGLAAEPSGRFPTMQALLGELERTPLTVRSVLPWAVATVGLLGAVASLAYALRPPLVPGCSPTDRTVSTSWNASLREQLTKTFEALAGPTSAGPAKMVSDSFDGYAQAWEREMDRACDAAKHAGGQRTPTLECLEGQRLSFVATVQVLSSADRALIDRAPLVAAALVPPSRCGQPGAASSTPRMPADPALLAPVQKVRIELAIALANNLAGRPEKAEELLAPLRAEAKRLGFKPLIGEVAFATVETRMLSVSPEHTLEAAEVAFHEAVLAGMDATAADVAAILAFVDVQIDKPERATEWLTVSRALLERAGGDPLVEARLENSTSVVLDSQGKTAEGHSHQLRAAELRAQVLGPRHPRTLSFMSNVAASYMDLCRDDEARKVLLQFDDENLARQLPGLSGVALERLASVFVSAGEWKDAERVARLAVEIDGDPRATTRRASHLAVLAWVLNLRGASEEAQRVAEEALAAIGDETSAWVGNQHVLIKVATIDVDEHRVAAATAVLDKLGATSSETSGSPTLRARLALPSNPDAAQRFLDAARAGKGCRSALTEASLFLIEAELAAARGRSSEVKAATAKALAVLPLDKWSVPMKQRLAALSSEKQR